MGGYMLEAIRYDIQSPVRITCMDPRIPAVRGFMPSSPCGVPATGQVKVVGGWVKDVRTQWGGDPERRSACLRKAYRRRGGWDGRCGGLWAGSPVAMGSRGDGRQRYHE